MTWDESSLTITVNPLDVSNLAALASTKEFLTLKPIFNLTLSQQIEQEHESQQLNDDDDDSDSSDDASSYHEDGETSEEEAENKTKTRQELEWDDTNF